MGRLGRLAGAAALAGAVGLGGPAATRAAGPATPIALPSESRAVTIIADRVTARAVAAPLGPLLEVLARHAGVRLDVAVGAGERVTARFDALALDEALLRLLPGRHLVFVYESDRADRAAPGAGRLIAVLGYGADDRAQPGHGGAPGPPAIPRGEPVESGGTAGAAGLLASASRDPDHDDTDVREAAARTLGRVADRAAIEALTEFLSRDPASRVREAAADALGRSWNEAAAPALEWALVHDLRRSVREAAARALGDIMSPSSAEPLVQALRDPSGAVRERAAAALGLVGGTLAIQALTAASESDPDPWVREEARMALLEVLDE